MLFVPNSTLQWFVLYSKHLKSCHFLTELHICGFSNILNLGSSSVVCGDLVIRFEYTDNFFCTQEDMWGVQQFGSAQERVSQRYISLLC